jgi:ribosome-associated translation inhibitor RaiA
MFIQLNTNESVRGDESMARRVEAEVGDALSHFEGQISSVDVHLSDANGTKHGADDKICVIEARPNGMAPVATSHQAESIAEALTVAAEKMQHRLEHVLGRRDRKKGGESIRGSFDSL